ncbi:hypothetical protein [Anaerovorax odorimutans]|uniref:hypothetical protein n=1 Tax=Anaerovorax odorimutans TaxID=109327 RepID=UPI000402CB5F|nr:hypothetical protein [Anaerovorax odorimutans]
MFYKIKQNSEQQSQPSNNNEFYTLLQEYLNGNPKTGYLVFQITQDSPLQGTVPIANAKITVSKMIGNNYFVSRVVTTNEDGKTIAIPLPTVDADLSLNPENIKPYATYSAIIETEGFLSTGAFDIPIFENITSIQPITLIPNPSGDRIFANQPKLF